MSVIQVLPINPSADEDVRVNITLIPSSTKVPPLQIYSGDYYHYLKNRGVILRDFVDNILLKRKEYHKFVEDNTEDLEGVFGFHIDG